MKKKALHIDIIGLRPGVYEYNFDLGQPFFQQFAQTLLESGEINVDINLEKNELMIRAKLKIKGFVNRICDRSLLPFEEPIDITETLLYKFGEEQAELDDNLFVIEYNQQSIDFSQPVYDLINISLPMKKLHPDYRTPEDILPMAEEDLMQGGNSVLFYSSSTDGTIVYPEKENVQEEVNEGVSKEEAPIIDIDSLSEEERWKANLIALKSKLNENK